MKEIGLHDVDRRLVRISYISNKIHRYTSAVHVHILEDRKMNTKFWSDLNQRRYKVANAYYLHPHRYIHRYDGIYPNTDQREERMDQQEKIEVSYIGNQLSRSFTGVKKEFDVEIDDSIGKRIVEKCWRIFVF